MPDSIAARRLRNQYITRPFRGGPAELVAWFGAVQAQEYGPARWGVGLRLAAKTGDAELARAVDEGRILRTHVMRPTWHFVTPADIRWMLELTAPRVHQRMATYLRHLGLDRTACVRAARVFERLLRDGQHHTRRELGAALARARMPVTGIRLGLLAMYAELEQVICSGAYRGKELTYALLSDRAPQARPLPRDEALAELTRRYFTSHAPATVRDFVWWSGLSTADARRGLEINRARKQAVDDLVYWTVGNPSVARSSRRRVHLLPIYDEYIVAYRDRQAVPLAANSMRWAAGEVTFQHAIVVDGQVAGTWKTPKPPASLEIHTFRPLSTTERREVDQEIDRYSRFIAAARRAAAPLPARR